jgi:hypothetical protein
METTFEDASYFLSPLEKDPKPETRAVVFERPGIFQIPLELFANATPKRNSPGPIGNRGGAYAEPIFVPEVREETGLIRIKRIGGYILASFTVLAWLLEAIARHFR